jgi:hypothetical protein
MIQAFGVARFGVTPQGTQAQKKAPQMISELNSQLNALGLTGDDVVTIHVDDEFYHVFYRKKTQPTEPQV